MKGRQLVILFIAVLVNGCSPFTTRPVPGPDKQSVGTMSGALSGAGIGAVQGAQFGATTSGAFIGAGFGAFFGMFSGLGIDLLEEDQIRRKMEENRLKELAWVHEVLAEHYVRRLELHPSRDIFPADWFFESDSSQIRPEALPLVKELAQLTRHRMPWSRMVIAVYNTTVDLNSTYANHLTKRRGEELALQFVRAGMEPRRLSTQAIPLPVPVLIDPDDDEGRYYQAVEIIALDR